MTQRVTSDDDLREQVEELLCGATSDEERAVLLRDEIQRLQPRLDALRSARDTVALRLRLEGHLRGAEIAELTGVGDSYLSRRALAAGAAPRLRRPA